MEMLSRLRDWLVIRFKGKRIAVLGARGVGKTHLLTYLSRGALPAKPAQTLSPEKVPARRFELGDQDIRLKATRDVSGDTASYREWQRVLHKADISLYLVRFDLISKNDSDHKMRVRDDAAHIRGMVKDTTPIVIVGTHCDLDPRYSEATAETLGNYFDVFRRGVEDVALRIGKPERIRYAFGSLKTLESAERLAADILKQVIE